MIAVLALLLAACSNQAPEEESENSAKSDSVSKPLAAAGILTLPIDSFPELPLEVQQTLRSHGCRIAQAYVMGEGRNVISGSFAKPGQTDWTVLCSRADSTGLVVVWGGEEACPNSLEWRPNQGWMQDVNGKMSFSRTINVASQAEIQRHVKMYGGTPAPTSDHDGVDDAMLEKGSVVKFCHAGKWIDVQGAD